MNRHGFTRWLAAEYHAFASQPKAMRLLLIADSIYATVMPVLEIFVAAYVLRNSHDARIVVAYQLSIYAAIPIAFLMNGFILQKVPANIVYAAGMLLSGVALLILTTTSVATWRGIVLSGGLLGIATGIFWANRGFLALSSTDDQNRNYFCGVETAVLTVTWVLVPWIVGSLIDTLQARVSNDGLNFAYRLVAIGSLVLTGVAAIVVLRGTYPRPVYGRFVFFRFHRLWYRLLVLAFLRGLTQGYIVTAPALLILRLVGREGTLGGVEAIGSCVASIGLYAIGRISRPKDRVKVLAAGVILFLVGASLNAMLFNAEGVLIFMGCLLMAKPLIDVAYGPLEFRTIDLVSQIEQRDQYAYLFHHELAVFAARFVGCALFIASATFASETAALRYALLIVAILQLPVIPAARKLRS